MDEMDRKAMVPGLTSLSRTLSNKVWPTAWRCAHPAAVLAVNAWFPQLLEPFGSERCALCHTAAG